MSFAIETENLTKTYITGRVETPALRGVTMRVERGEFLSIVGPSGSGKSTLLNLLGALDKPTSGIVRIDGVDISTLNENELAELRNKKIGFIFQSFNLISRLSALRNVEMPLLVTKIPKAERRARALQMLEAVGLLEKADRKPTELSGGEQQRVAVARALVSEPSIILGDEPTGNLDTKNTANLVKLLKELNEKTGKTFLMITHNMEVAKETRRIIYLRDGMIDKDVRQGG
ncbi:MAG: ABC transporter ATP-binding protein [Candidatus Bathyarchaeia archaeon]